MRFYTTQKLGPNRERTPEGFLLCRNVPIARTGIQVYGPDETPIESTDGGPVQVHRESDQVFRPETIASFNGKPFTIDHPNEDVTPANWRELTKGVIVDPHRGIGIEDDLLLADVVVFDSEAMQMIEDEGVIEVSAGYDAGYVQDEAQPGKGYQVDILGNHVALVRNGRCGPRCSIRDEAEDEMKAAVSTVQKIRDSIRSAFQTKDEKALDAALSEITDQAASEFTDQKPEAERETHIHIHGEETTDQEQPTFIDRLASIDRELKLQNDRLSKIEDRQKSGDKEVEDKKDDEEEDDEEEETHDKDVEEETSDSVRDEAIRVSDSRYMEESIQATMAAAEILSPGISYPFFDRAHKPGETVKSLTSLRKKALGILSGTTPGATLLSELRGGKQLDQKALDKMTAHDTRTLFFSAAAQAKQRNRDQLARREFQASEAPQRITSIADMNRRNREFWKERGF